MALFSWLKKAPTVATVGPVMSDPAQQAKALRKRGNALLDQGQTQAAADCYAQAVALAPDDADARISLGYVLSELQRTTEAEPHLRAAVRLAPGSFDAHYLLAGVLRTQGQTVPTIAHLREALALKPDFEICRRDLIRALFDCGELEAARAVAEEGLRLAPQSPAMLHFLGNVHAAAGRWLEATGCYKQALQAEPRHVPLLQSLAVALKAQGHARDAIEALREVVVLEPGSADARLQLGSALQQIGQLDVALACYKEALALDPQLAEAHSNSGAALLQKGQIAAAVASCRRAIALRPEFAAAHTNLGNALQQDGDLTESVASYRRALELQADADSHNNLAGALLGQGRVDEAIAEFRAALELRPTDPAAGSNLLFALNYHPDKSAEEIFEAYRDFERRLTDSLPAAVTRHGNDRGTTRRLRIGYVSPDFRHHPVRYFLQPLLEHHDRRAFEIFAYSEGAIEDSVTSRYRECADHWTPTLGMTTEVLAERIRADQIDVLVDLAGHTGHNRLAVFALKPAPVSLSWLGYGYTTGLSAIDYFLTDAEGAPPGSEGLFAERPWRIANPAYVFRPAPEMGGVGELPAMRRGHVTFGTLTRAVRVNHRTVRVWSEILRRVPDSRLVIDSQQFKQAGMQVEIAARFAARGVARDRLQIGYRSPASDVLRGIDIALDCFPHNSGTTLFESLYMGLPFVTLAGRPSVGRLGSSILHGVGHPEWIATTEEEYVEKVVALASDLPRLAALRAGLRAEMQAGALMDEAGFARRVEAAYREMFAAWAAAPQRLT